MNDDFRAAPGDQPETVQGEIVQDESAAAFSGAKGQDPAAGSSAESPAFGSGPAGAFGWAPAGALGSPLGARSLGAALRLLTDSSPELRSMLAAPLRLLSISALVPSLLAALAGLLINGNARFLAFAIAICGGVVGAMLEVSRRRLVAGNAAAAPVAVPTGRPRPTRRGLKAMGALIGAALLVTMLAIGFDLLAVLLLVFNVW